MTRNVLFSDVVDTLEREPSIAARKASRTAFRHDTSSGLTETVVVLVPDGWYVTHLKEDDYGRAMCACFVPDDRHKMEPAVFASDREAMVFPE